tara:strand:+ start:341 stop:772 length:432 start_codon:yes stop_codon:yes gene_type:complete
LTYVTQQQLIDRFGEKELIQLTDRVNRPATTIDDTVVDGAIADAVALVDGYVGKVYKLPVSPVPTVLTRMSADIARYYLHGKSADKDGPVHRAYLEAVAWLKDVSKGLVSIDADGVVSAPAGGGSIRAKTGDRVFTRDSLKGM